MALSLSPLTPDPGYEHTTVFYPKGRSRDPAPQCRVRPEARAIALAQSQGTIARLLQDGGDFPPPSFRSKKPPLPNDHSRANRGRIREQAERGRRKREEVDKTVPLLLPSSSAGGKYSHVPSKVITNLQSRPNTAQPHPNTAHPRPDRSHPRPDTAQPHPDRSHPRPDPAQPRPDRSHPHPDTAQPRPDRSHPRPDTAQPRPDRSHPHPDTAQPRPDRSHPRPDTAQPRPDTAQPRPDRSHPRPSTAQPPQSQTQASSTPSSSHRKQNYLAANIRGASRLRVRQDPQQEKLAQLQKKRDNDFSSHQKGKLPQYLVSRRLQWKKAEEERLANRPDPSVPPGHTVMSNKDRRHTLDVLNKYQSALTQELSSLPLRTDTLRHRLKRTELESKLTEIEDALKIFSRPKVFVKLED